MQSFWRRKRDVLLVVIFTEGNKSHMILNCAKGGKESLLVNIDSKFDPMLFVSLPHWLLAKLERADRAFCFTSGMAALSAVANLVGSGQEIVAGDDIYGGSDRLLSRVTPKSGVLVKRVNTSDLDEVAAVIGPKTKLVGLESPTNPQLQIADIRRVSAIAHANGARVGRRQYYVTSIVTTVGTWSRIRWYWISQEVFSASVTADYITGSVKALISLPCFMSHASIPSAVRDARGLTEDLVRI
ncbi:hypothetical protein V6N13_103705 [Hibiscus sabdariffa]